MRFWILPAYMDWSYVQTNKIEIEFGESAARSVNLLFFTGFMLLCPVAFAQLILLGPFMIPIQMIRGIYYLVKMLGHKNA